MMRGPMTNKNKPEIFGPSVMFDDQYAKGGGAVQVVVKGPTACD